MIESKKFKKLLDFAYEAYQEKNISGQAYRQKGRVPYLVHPLWCATTFIMDTTIPWKERELGFQVLILHDVLEDTSLKFPKWVDEKVKKTVEEMTFKNWEQTKKEIPEKAPFIKLLILVDKLSSMYEKHVEGAKQKEWKKIIVQLLKNVEKNYGNIRIVQIGKVIVKNTSW